MNVGVPLAHFDRGKPFYPLVMQYIIHLIGYKDLGCQGEIGESVICDAIARLSLCHLNDKQQRHLGFLLSPLELKSAVLPDRLNIPTDIVAKELASNVMDGIRHVLVSAANVLILAHELCKDKAAHDTGPLWEFLRHCRNAAGHGGYFNLLNGEPKRPAMWRSLEILPSLQGTPLLQAEQDGAFFLGPADPILLLWDIEQAYPGLA
jgi:hypothetical protein